jgi:hypothetical protein
MSTYDSNEEMLQSMRRNNASNALRAMEKLQKDPQKKTYLPALAQPREQAPRLKKRVRPSKPRSETPTQIRDAAQRELLQSEYRDSRLHFTQGQSQEASSQDFTIQQQPTSESLADAKDEQALLLQLLDLQTQIKNSSPAIGAFLSGAEKIDSLFEHEIRACALFLRHHNLLLKEYLSPAQQIHAADFSAESDGVAAESHAASDEDQEKLSVPISQLSMGKAQRRRIEKKVTKKFADAQILRKRALEIVNCGGIRMAAQSRENVNLESELRPEERRTLLILTPLLRSSIAGRPLNSSESANEATEGLQELVHMRYDFFLTLFST